MAVMRTMTKRGETKIPGEGLSFMRPAKATIDPGEDQRSNERQPLGHPAPGPAPREEDHWHLIEWSMWRRQKQFLESGPGEYCRPSAGDDLGQRARRAPDESPGSRACSMAQAHHASPEFELCVHLLVS